MFMNVSVAIMTIIAVCAGVWGWVVDHRKDKDNK